MTEIAMGSPSDIHLPTQDTSYVREANGAELKPCIRYVHGCPDGLKWFQSVVVRIPSKPARVPTYDECVAAIPKAVCRKTVAAIQNPIHATAQQAGEETIYVLSLYREESRQVS